MLRWQMGHHVCWWTKQVDLDFVTVRRGKSQATGLQLPTYTPSVHCSTCEGHMGPAVHLL